MKTWPDCTWHWLYTYTYIRCCYPTCPFIRFADRNTVQFSAFSANEERAYCFWKHKNRKFSQGRHVQEQGWAASPCLFPFEKAVSALHTMAMTSCLLPDRQNLATCTLFPLWQNIFIDSNVELTNPLEKRVCSGCFLSRLFLHKQRGWVIVQQHLSVLAVLYFLGFFASMSAFVHR